MPVRVWGWLEAFSFLQTVPSHGTIRFGSASWLSRRDGGRFGLGGSSLARGCLFWVWNRQDQRCQLGFGGGSRPSSFRKSWQAALRKFLKGSGRFWKVGRLWHVLEGLPVRALGRGPGPSVLFSEVLECCGDLSGPLVPKVASEKSLKGSQPKRTIRRMVRSAPRFGVPYSKGDLTGYSPAARRA